MKKLTHLDSNGNAVMVDVSDKKISNRKAIAKGKVSMQIETLNLIKQGKTLKGDVLAVARIAGIMAAKKTSELIPLCHPIPLTNIIINFELLEHTSEINIEAICKTTYSTGVEMEALTAVSTAALTIYDMCKGVDKGMKISDVYLDEKTGGKSGSYRKK
tara:strand:+ start:519 stop:995 length:477 start_codon:yes stop_codon:yes gene_type:complete